jgi:diguanylate cyclase (GGDEF)-like protein
LRAYLRARRPGLRSILMTLALALIGLPGAHALPLADRFVEVWTTRDGLPHSTVHGIGQTPDGFLWLATWEGLVRYDGHDFHLYRRSDIPGLLDDGVRALHIGASGDLWAGSARGGIVRWHAGHWRALAPVHSLVTDLLDAGDGTLWVATLHDGVVRIDGAGRRSAITVADGLPGETVNALARDSAGQIWAGTSQGLVRIEGALARPEGVGSLPAGPVFSLKAMPDGRLLVGTEHGAYVGGARGFSSLHPALAAFAITRLWRDADGSVWAGTNSNGLARVVGDRLEWLDTGKGLPNNRVLALQRDREGSLWVGTNGGLARVRVAPIHTYTRADGLADDFVRTTLVDRAGQLWIGSGQGLDRLDPRTGAMGRVDLGARLADVSVLSLAQDAGGDVLAGTFHDGLLRLHEGRLVATLTMRDGLPANEVRAILPARDGRLWIATKQGLVLRDGTRSRTYTTRDGLPSDFVQALYEDSDGTVWAGTAAGAVRFVRDVPRAVDMGRSDALYVYGFLPSVDRQALWLATDRGLVRVPRQGDGPAVPVGREQGLPFEKIFSIVADPHGRLWLTGNEGVVGLRLADIEAVAAGRSASVEARLYGRADGMVSAQANGGSMPAASLDGDGHLWVATAQGVARLDPTTPVYPPVPLPGVSVESVEVDGRAVDPAVSPLLPPGEHRIVVRFVDPALLSAPRVRYRYRLGGAGASWIELGTSREVQLTHLDPGRFTLELQAWLPGEPGRSSTRFAFTLQAHWWQRPWVWGALLAALALMIYAAFRIRVRQLRRSERRLRAQVEERTAELQVQTQIAEQLARTDTLTLLANRRAVDQALAAHAQPGREPDPVSLILLDVDGFKPINDQFGHAAGDIGLRHVAEVLREHAPHPHLAARWGGDEFAVLLDQCDLAQAVALAEAIRAAVQAIDCSAFAPGITITASLGVACAEPQRGDRSLATLVARADRAVYQAKHEGRNRVRAAAPLASPEASHDLPANPRAIDA